MKYKLNIEIPFTDKITKEEYKVGDVKEFDENRAKELLDDKRKLVSLNETIDEKPKTDKDTQGEADDLDDKDKPKERASKK